MTRRFIDISVALDADLVSDPPMMAPQVTYLGHDATADQVASFFPGLTKDQLPDGEGWAIEMLQIATHNGTHLGCALPPPFHHEPRARRRGRTGGDHRRGAARMVLQPGRETRLPPYGRRLRLHPGRCGGGAETGQSQVAAAGYRGGQHIGRRGLWPPDYINRGCGIGRDATLWLLERGVRVTGTDAWSWDAPFAHTAERWKTSGDPSIIWEGHRASMEIGYCHMEKLSNLEAVPATGFEVSCFPWKIKRASAGFTRAVAIVEE